ncbi:MAG: ATP-binding protein [Balneolaceae bacterium]|nr:MAG: ATP-binding protein [Balneolaceae bacterium]
MKAFSYHKIIKASTEHLSEVREFVSMHAGLHGFNDKEIADIRLAVDEACTNIIKHAYKYDPSKEIGIVITVDDEKFMIVITDQGEPFDKKKYQKPSLKKQIAQKKRGGMGVHLMRKLMDEVRYSKTDNLNTLCMCKNRIES